MNAVFKRLRRPGAAIAMLSLAALHAAFLWQRVADDSIREPRVMGRWLASALLLACLFLVRRYVARPLRFLLAFWLLAAILHAAVPANEHFLDVRESQLAAIAVVGGLLVAAASSPNHDRRLEFISRIAPIVTLCDRRVAVVAIGTRAPPAH